MVTYGWILRIAIGFIGGTIAGLIMGSELPWWMEGVIGVVGGLILGAFIGFNLVSCTIGACLLTAGINFLEKAR